MADLEATPTSNRVETAFSEAVASFTAAQDTAKAQLAAVNGEIEALEAEHRRVSNAAPHTDDIIALFIRGVRSTAGQYERDLAEHLKAEFIGNDGRAAQASTRSPFILDEALRVRDREALQTRRMRGAPAMLDLGALAFFMRDKLEAEVPPLVARLFPAGHAGMKAADRREQLRVIDGQLAPLRARAAEMNDQLIALRAAARGRR